MTWAGRTRPSHPELLDELTTYFIKAAASNLRELYRTLATPTPTSGRASGRVDPARHRSCTFTCRVKDAHRRAALRFGQSRAASAATEHDERRQRPTARCSIRSGRPSSPRCSRRGRNFLEYQAGVLQALALLNGSDLAEATDPERSPLLGSLNAPFFTEDDRLAALFLAVLSRQPAQRELELCENRLASDSAADRTSAYSDILWTLLNSAEFALNH